MTSSRRTASLWSVGDRCEALADDAIAFLDDEHEHWLPATVVQVMPSIAVHFDGYRYGTHIGPDHVALDEIREEAP